MTEKMTAKQALDGLRKAVDEVGADFTYQGEFGEDICQYFIEGQPGCIVGRVLNQIGIEPLTVKPYEGYRVLNNNRGAKSVEATRFFDTLFSKKALKVLYAAQVAQDEGANWGTALYAARMEYTDRTDAGPHLVSVTNE